MLFNSSHQPGIPKGLGKWDTHLLEPSPQSKGRTEAERRRDSSALTLRAFSSLASLSFSFFGFFLGTLSCPSTSSPFLLLKETQNIREPEPQRLEHSTTWTRRLSLFQLSAGPVAVSRGVCADAIPFRTYSAAKERLGAAPEPWDNPVQKSLVGPPIPMAAPYETHVLLSLHPGNCSLPTHETPMMILPALFLRHPDTKERPQGVATGPGEGQQGPQGQTQARPIALPCRPSPPRRDRGS